jgi:hypothetical protein
LKIIFKYEKNNTILCLIVLVGCKAKTPQAPEVEEIKPKLALSAVNSNQKTKHTT